ncbi:MAG: RluA family pseudouridine synthase [Lachnospiraceae bacterium]|nr:RluA family pseudouridine synthase [Lachnospiraceae bacterium]
MQSFVIGKNEAGQRFDKFLKKYLKGAQASFIYKMLRKKNITLNGKKADGKEILVEKDEVKTFFSDETFLKLTGGGNNSLSTDEYIKAYKSLHNIDIIFEDEDILIANKPAGVLTQQTKAGEYSLNEWLTGYLLDSRKLTEDDLTTFKPSVCNRLDINTSGIVLCGKSLRGLQGLSEDIKKRNIRKLYLTVCHGRVSDRMQLNGFLNWDEAKKRASITDDKAKGERIETIITPLKYYESADVTLLEAELITGKHHQIRAHLASIGHPVIGDKKYGDLCLNKALNEKCKLALTHQLLFAHRVILPDGREFTAKDTAFDSAIQAIQGENR